jgi:hypothetical protein
MGGIGRLGVWGEAPERSIDGRKGRRLCRDFMHRADSLATCPTKLYPSFLRKTFAPGEVGAVGTAQSMLTDRVWFGSQLGGGKSWVNGWAVHWPNRIRNIKPSWALRTLLDRSGASPNQKHPTRRVRLFPVSWVTLYRLDEHTCSIKRFARCLRFFGRKSRLREWR